jgi:hypothetical protein
MTLSMKSLLLLIAAIPLVAQEPTAPQEAPAVPEKAEEKPELPARVRSQRDEELLKLLDKNPTPEGRRKEAENAAVVEKKDEKKDDAGVPGKAAGTEVIRQRGRTTLLPPVTSSDLDLRIRYRKARTFAEQDPAVVSAWEASRSAKTDYAKREALKTYYTLIQRKVLAVDRGVASVINERHNFAMRRLDQTRVEPTDPLDEDARNRQ